MGNNTSCTNSDNVIKSECISWCKESNNSSKCDDAAAEYCKRNLDNNEFCSCFDANARNALPAKIKNLPEIKKSKAICFSTKCADNGYVTHSMKALTGTCPKCIQSIDFSDIDVNEGDAVFKNIKQSCNTESDSGSITYNNVNSDGDGDGDNSKKMIIIMIILMILFISAMASSVMMSDY